MILIHVETLELLSRDGKCLLHTCGLMTVKKDGICFWSANSGVRLRMMGFRDIVIAVFHSTPGNFTVRRDYEPRFFFPEQQ